MVQPYHGKQYRRKQEVLRVQAYRKVQATKRFKATMRPEDQVIGIYGRTDGVGTPGGSYGPAAMGRVTDVLRKNFGVHHQDKILDLGSGTGRAAILLHEFLGCPVVGIECDDSPLAASYYAQERALWDLAALDVSDSRRSKRKAVVLTKFLKGDINNMKDLGCATVLYLNLCAAGKDVYDRVGKLFNSSPNCNVLVTSIEPEKGIEPIRAGFHVDADSCHSFKSQKMSKGGSSRVIQIFKRDKTKDVDEKKKENEQLIKDSFKELFAIRNKGTNKTQRITAGKTREIHMKHALSSMKKKKRKRTIVKRYQP